MSQSIFSKLIPLSWVVKYDPPQIGLVYKENKRDKKKRIYIIDLNELVEIPDSYKVANRLFLEHPLYLNRSVIKIDQLAGLVQKIQEELQIEHEEHDQYEYEHEEQDSDGQHERSNRNNFPYEEIDESEYQ